MFVSTDLVLLEDPPYPVTNPFAIGARVFHRLDSLTFAYIAQRVSHIRRAVLHGRLPQAVLDEATTAYTSVEAATRELPPDVFSLTEAETLAAGPPVVLRKLPAADAELVRDFIDNPRSVCIYVPPAPPSQPPKDREDTTVDVRRPAVRVSTHTEQPFLF